MTNFLEKIKKIFSLVKNKLFPELSSPLSFSQENKIKKIDQKEKEYSSKKKHAHGDKLINLYEDINLNESNEKHFNIQEDNEISHTLNKNDHKKEKEVDNKDIESSQHRKLALVILGFVVAVYCFKFLLSTNKQKQSVEKALTRNIELAGEALSPDDYWRNHLEEKRIKDKEEFDRRLIEKEKEYQEKLDNSLFDMRQELNRSKTELQQARSSLVDASLDLKRVAEEERVRNSLPKPHKQVPISVDEFRSSYEMDAPKSTRNYIPEGTYFRGKILGGLAVSTALNTADNNATPVNIRLDGRGNLSPNNPVEIDKCRIMGSAYGDLSSERAVVRLEKMICEYRGHYITSDLVGIVYGDDGLNGIKGTVVATSTKHIRSAMIGGMISGFTSALKGEDGLIASGGLLGKKKKGARESVRAGFLSGTSSAGEKLANYYLRRAEAMSPVLVIKAGALVETMITRGFFVGQRGTHKIVREERVYRDNSSNRDINRTSNLSDYEATYGD